MAVGGESGASTLANFSRSFFACNKSEGTNGRTFSRLSAFTFDLNAWIFRDAVCTVLLFYRTEMAKICHIIYWLWREADSKTDFLLLPKREKLRRGGKLKISLHFNRSLNLCCRFPRELPKERLGARGAGWRKICRVYGFGELRIRSRHGSCCARVKDTLICPENLIYDAKSRSISHKSNKSNLSTSVPTPEPPGRYCFASPTADTSSGNIFRVD